MIRTIEEWQAVFKQPQFATAPLTVKVDRILGDVIGYRYSTSFRNDDCAQIANAMLAIFVNKQIVDIA